MSLLLYLNIFHIFLAISSISIQRRIQIPAKHEFFFAKTINDLPSTIFTKNPLNYRSACYYRVTCAFQSESILYSFLNFKELLARNRRDIWALIDSKGRDSWARIPFLSLTLSFNWLLNTPLQVIDLTLSWRRSQSHRILPRLSCIFKFAPFEISAYNQNLLDNEFWNQKVT